MIKITVDELELEWRDLEGETESFGLQIQQGSLVVSAAQLPTHVGVVSAARLEHGHWVELVRRELDLALGEVKASDFSRLVMAPLSASRVPNRDLHFSRLLAHVNRAG